MKFLEKLKSRKLAKVLSAAAVGGMLFTGSGDVQAAANDIQTFRESYTAAAEGERYFHQVATFFGGTVFKADVNSEGMVSADNSLNIAGTLDWSFTSPRTKQTTNLKIPFYVAQSGDNDMIVYVQRNNTWSKITLPGFPAEISSILKANDLKTLQANAAAVKSAEVYSDDANQTVMKLVVDGKYIAGVLSKYDNQSGDDAVIHDALKNTFSNNDIQCSWTYDKTKKQTVTATIELTDAMRGYARSLLDASAAGKIKFDQSEMDLLASMGYYSEFHYAITMIDKTSNILVPSSAITSSPENDHVFDDLETDMVAVVQK